MIRSTKENCIYCRAKVADSADHVPPKTIFAKPYPNNLITVPSCIECNNSFSKDDEYLGLLCLSKESAIGDGCRPVYEKVIRSLNRPEALGFRTNFTKTLHERKTVSSAGEILSVATAFMVEGDRIKRVLRRIVEGLFYDHERRPLAIGYRIDLFPFQRGAKNTTADTELPKDEIFNTMRNVPTIEIGSTFTYRLKKFEEETPISAWIISIFNVIDCYCVIVPADMPNDDQGICHLRKQKE